MANRPIIHVFPGQGDFSVQPLAERLDEPVIRKNFARISTRIEDVGAAYGIPALGPLILSREPAADRQIGDLGPGAQQLAMYVAQMTIHAALCDIGHRPDRILGVSFGEIAALAAAGALSLEDGARSAIRAARSLLHCRGGMTLLLASPERAQDLIAQAGQGGAAIACVNHDTEVLITSPDTRELDCLEQYAADHRLRAIRLPLPFCSHHPSLKTEAEDLCRTMRRVTLRPATVPVYSAVHARAYVAGDDLVRRVADSLVLPFDLPAALTATDPGEPALWLEVNSGRALTRSARHTLLPPHVLHAPVAEPSFIWEPKTLVGVDS